MARDNSPKERQHKQLERKQGRRASYDRILIVSEGSKTEPNYFREIRAAYRLHTANVAVWSQKSGMTPIEAVEFARKLFINGNTNQNIQPRAFEQVYIVFDRDDHSSYFDALRMAESLNGTFRNEFRQPVVFRAIASVPCFELWLLLHYEDIKSPLDRNVVIRRLKQFIPNYEKGADRIFEVTKERLPIATQNAHRLAEYFTAYTDPEPFTAIAELVMLLTKLRN